ncbi:hypothetical protein M408DRAFT_331673 [Serendipita vermifera MAFF 305830]|uniref:Uncharacterized protein n=1 Tax=Serendipita vermifera MAFF 305830 TaxID=933852 RepID=A0A0C3AZN6_SERVB|nr:hypothetical protein M408DRAFT_331673 [Serendipita vermifera MAFF 305830]
MGNLFTRIMQSNIEQSRGIRNHSWPPGSSTSLRTIEIVVEGSYLMVRLLRVFSTVPPLFVSIAWYT